MKKIPLRNKKGSIIAFTLVDDIFFSFLIKKRWHAQGKGKDMYVEHSFLIKKGHYGFIKLHRLIVDAKKVNR